MNARTKVLIMDRKIVERLVDGQSFNKIARDLGVGKRRIKKLYSKALGTGYITLLSPLPPFPEKLFSEKIDPIIEKSNSSRKSQYDELLLPHLEDIKTKIELGYHQVTIIEELPIIIPKSSFSRFLKRHDLELKKKLRGGVVPEILTAPGDVLQLDWGKIRDVIDPETGKKKTLWALVGVLGFSRFMMVKFVWTNSVEITMNTIEEMLRELGGVPRKIVSDNPKCFATTASLYEPVINVAMERFAYHYGITLELLPPRRPELKGKVERLMPYTRRLFESFKEFKSLEQAQEHMNKKLIIANERKHGTLKKRPIDMFLLDEAHLLKELPPLAFSREEYQESKVRKDGYICFRSKFYSVGEKLSSAMTFVIGNEDTVSIYLKGELLESHSRIKNTYQTKSTKKYHLRLWDQIQDDHEMYLSRARAIGESVELMVASILKQGNGFVDTRKVWGILSLDKSYPLERINRACQMCLELEQFSYQSLRRILEMNDGLLTKEESKLAGKNKYVRSTSEYAEKINFN
jgi:transposase